MTQEHLYGCTESDIDAMAVVIGPLLDLRLENRNSAYWGDYYLDRSGVFSELRFYRNRDPMFQADSDDPDEYWFEPEFCGYDLLLSIYATESVLFDFHQRIAFITPKFRLLRPSVGSQ